MLAERARRRGAERRAEDIADEKARNRRPRSVGFFAREWNSPGGRAGTLIQSEALGWFMTYETRATAAVIDYVTQSGLDRFPREAVTLAKQCIIDNTNLARLRGSGELAVIVPISFIVQMLPVSMNGFGVREATFGFYFSRLGLSLESALLVSFVGAALIMSFSLSGGVTYMARQRRRPTSSA